MLSEAVKPHGGLIIWRCFVYNCKQDWRDNKTDRAKSGYDNFMPIDGKFAENVILQIKNGPMDFQVREPVSPLFGGLKKTNMMLEVQIAQEYTGQQRHVCYLIPWFKEILASHTYCKENQETVSDIVAGRTYQNKNCGMAAVANTGNDINWTGHDLAAANLYGFGRLAYDTELTAEEIGKEWIIQTFGQTEKVKEVISKILMMSWPAYEKYTSPLGIGWMVKPATHYGPDVDGYEYDRWGTYHKADHKGIGVDRTEKGTGYCSQYNEPLAARYADIKTCPEELLLFFHHVPYDYVLSSGKTVLQHIYDTHFEGAIEAEQFLKMWKELEELIDKEAYQRTLKRFIHQKDHAAEWRDVINSYFYRKTLIPDQYGRPLY
jgi:alpha-glucuronidase